MQYKYKENPLWVTIYTDASGTGGWAAWVRCSLPPYLLTLTGTHPHQNDSTAMEAYGILEATKATIATWSGVDGLRITTDSQAAIRLLQSRHSKTRNKALRAIKAEFNTITQGKWVKLVWKKGHCSDTSKQTWVNNWCDSNARRE